MPPERLTAALALDEYAEAFRARCHKKGIALGVTRIGVHAGPAIVGNFGGGRFFDYTAYSAQADKRASRYAIDGPFVFLELLERNAEQWDLAIPCTKRRSLGQVRAP